MNRIVNLLHSRLIIFIIVMTFKHTFPIFKVSTEFIDANWLSYKSPQTMFWLAI